MGKTAKSVAELKGQSITWSSSASPITCSPAPRAGRLAEKDVTVVNTSDADIVSVFSGTEDVENVVTWNPLLSEVAAFPAPPSCSTARRSPARSST